MQWLGKARHLHLQVGQVDLYIELGDFNVMEAIKADLISVIQHPHVNSFLLLIQIISPGVAAWNGECRSS